MAEARILGDEQRAFYSANGYLLLPQCVPEAVLVGVQTSLEALVDERIREWQHEAVISESFADLDFASRYFTAWCSAGRPSTAERVPDGESFTKGRADPPVVRWLEELVAEVIDAERVAALPSCFWRAKFPGDETTSLPWHQDAQCISPIYGVDFVTAWIPLVDISEDGSCLQVAPVGEGVGMFPTTWSERSGYVCMQAADVDRLSRARAIGMRRGDVLLLSPYLPHRSRHNTGDQTRWSIDLRYTPV